MNKKLSVILPVFNEEKSIKKVIEDIKKVLNKHNLNYEIICVDDGSTDKSAEIIEKIDGVKLIKHNENKGYGAALKTGIKNAKYDTICIMDSDGQHNPEDIIRLLKHYKSPTQMIIGERKITDTYKSRIFGKIFIYLFASYLFKFNIKDLNSGFRIFSKKVVSKYFHHCSDRFSFSTSLTLIYIGNSLEIIYVPIKVKMRKEGKSHVNIISGLKTIYKIIQIALLYKPIRLFFPIWIVISLIGIICFIIDFKDGNLTDSTVLLLLMSVLIFLFTIISEQLNVIRIEILERLLEKNGKDEEEL